MKAEDTRIMKDEVTFCGKDMDEQAEISFLLGKQEGMREVVEWADLFCPHGTRAADYSKALTRECEQCWEAKLREWFPRASRR